MMQTQRTINKTSSQCAKNTSSSIGMEEACATPNLTTKGKQLTPGKGVSRQQHTAQMHLKGKLDPQR